ncbi:MAG: exosortase [Phycisphaerales bacterium]
MTDKSTLQGPAIRTIVLVGGRDFGRCPLAARLPAALWPIGDRPALVRLLDHLAKEGIARATVCCEASLAEDVASVCRDSRLAVTVMPEELISGTGGCLRDAASSDPGDLILVFSASMAAAPPVGTLIDAHRSGGADMTVVFNPGRPDGESPGPSAEIFLCGPQVLGHIPAGGYSDIKEGVIPAVLRAGGVIRPHVLDRSVGNFRDRRGYIEAVEMLLDRGESDGLSTGVCEESQGGPVFKGVDAFVHRDARIWGPVLIGDHAKVREGVVVIGPAIIGRDVVVGENSAVVRSALWAGALVGKHCEIRESILDYRASVPDDAAVVGRTVPAAISEGSQESGTPLSQGSAGRIGELLKSYLDRWAGGSTGGAGFSRRHTTAILGGLVVLMALLWSYWPTVSEMIQVWRRSDEYSSGMLVPLLAVYVIWARREEIASAELRPALLWGVVALLCAQMCRGFGLYYMYQSGERLSLILSATALVLLMTGWQYLRKLWPVLLFLCLMLPWPNRVQAAISLPLQRWSTSSAVFCLELGGWEIVRSGNTIEIEGVPLFVAEACNGLRMITAFFVISGLVVLLTRRSWWEKLIVLLSSVPIALLCNTVRLVVTAMLYTVIENETGRKWIHDWDGYAMMPLALAMVVGELWLLLRLTTPPTELEPAIISRRQPQQVPHP